MKKRFLLLLSMFCLANIAFATTVLGAETATTWGGLFGSFIDLLKGSVSINPGFVSEGIFGLIATWIVGLFFRNKKIKFWLPILVRNAEARVEFKGGGKGKEKHEWVSEQMLDKLGLLKYVTPLDMKLPLVDKKVSFLENLNLLISAIANEIKKNQ